MPTYIENATISSGAATSSALNMKNKVLMALKTPSTWTTADITFQVSIDGTNYNDLYDSDGEEVTFTVVAGKQQYSKDPIAYIPFNYLVIRSGTTATPVNQAGDRTITAVFDEES
jgi:hypothetical protein